MARRTHIRVIQKRVLVNCFLAAGCINDGDEVCELATMKKSIYWVLALVMLMGAGTFVAGCRTNLHYSAEQDVPGLTGQGKDRSPVPAALGTARLRPGLVINIIVLVSGKKEIEATGKRVTDKGTIAMPFLGSVTVRDLTLDELGLKLTTDYREYFINPQVIVEFIRDDNNEGLSPWGSVTVLGRVKKSGKISLPATRDLTLSGAIQQAGGFDTSAKENGIRISRKRPGGGVKTWEVDLRSVGAEGLIENDILLEPDDVVFIPELVF